MGSSWVLSGALRGRGEEQGRGEGGREGGSVYGGGSHGVTLWSESESESESELVGGLLATKLRQTVGQTFYGETGRMSPRSPLRKSIEGNRVCTICSILIFYISWDSGEQHTVIQLAVHRSLHDISLICFCQISTERFPQEVQLHLRVTGVCITNSTYQELRVSRQTKWQGMIQTPYPERNIYAYFWGAD